MFNLLVISSFSQTNPIITSWLINNTGITGRHYLSGSSTILIDTSIPANVQTVQYSATSAYISTQGIPSFVTGPFINNPRPVAAVQNALFKFPFPFNHWYLLYRSSIISISSTDI